jgi:hypothetical protein
VPRAHFVLCQWSSAPAVDAHCQVVGEGARRSLASILHHHYFVPYRGLLIRDLQSRVGEEVVGRLIARQLELCFIRRARLGMT